MNESFYVAVATVAPVLLLGTVLAFRISENEGQFSRFFLGYSLIFAIVGVVGATASLLGALYALGTQTDLLLLVNTLMWWTLAWLTSINIVRIVDPFLSGLALLRNQSKMNRLKAKEARLRMQIEEIEERTERLWKYAAAIEAQAGISARASRLVRASRKTRLLAKRR